ncbi:SAM-dependent methyltransferase [Streptomyces sp. NPDC003860]
MSSQQPPRDHAPGTPRSSPRLGPPAAPSYARLYAALLGGEDARDAYDVDVELAGGLSALGLDLAPAARANRNFMARAILHVARTGLAQFVDVGCGLPPASNRTTQHFAETVHPRSARTLYLDHDPVVVSHAAALMRGSRGDETVAEQADLRNPDHVLDLMDTHLDMERPVALLLGAVVHHVDDAAARESVRTLVDALPAGSAVVFSHLTDDFPPSAMRTAQELLADAHVPLWFRSPESIGELFQGLDVGAGGVVPVDQWAVSGEPPCGAHLQMVGGVGWKR